MLHARLVLSPYASARIVSVDTSAAQGIEGVVAVLREGDLPSRGRPITTRQGAVLARDRVVFAGQPVALVLAVTEAAAAEGAQLVDVTYEPDVPVLDMKAAMADDSPLVWKDGVELAAGASIHAAVDSASAERGRRMSNIVGHVHFTRGDVSGGLSQASVVVERTYRTSFVHQSYLEPHAAVADFDPVRRELAIYTGTQGSFLVRDLVAGLVGLEPRQVRVVPMLVGGGFGAKYGILEPLVATASMVAHRPVRLVLSRSEDFATTTPAPSCEISLQLGVAPTGELCALKAKVISDNGALPVEPDGIGGIAGVLLGGFYRCGNVDIECFDVLTNRPPAGAYRAPGAPPVAFALESAVDEAARQRGEDPLEFRLRNVARPGEPMGNGDPWPSLGLVECLERLRDLPQWVARGNLGAGEGVGLAIGCWPGAVSPAAALCKVDVDGSVEVQVGSADISGAHGSLALVAAEVLDIDPARVALVPGDTRSAPHGPPAGGSQTTYSVAGAVRAAAQEARRQLTEIAAQRLEAAPEDLEFKAGRIEVRGAPTRFLTVSDAARAGAETPGGSGPVAGHGRASLEVNAPGAAAHLVRVRVDPETGRVDLVAYLAVQDVGFALNPLLVTGQVHGGVGQGIGWGLFEAMHHDSDGQLVTSTFVDYAIPAIDSMPRLAVELVENPSPGGPYGARIVGEPPVVPVAAAIANGIAAAVGVRVTELPMSPDVVWRSLDVIHGHV